MTSPDLKKLVTGFLLLSTLVSVSFLFFTNTGSKSGPADSATSETKGVSVVGSNAFVEQIPQASFTAAIESSLQNMNADGEKKSAAPVDPNNLTDVFIQKFTEQIASNNPNGPVQDETGTPLLNLPDDTYVSQLIAETARASPVDMKGIAPDRTVQVRAKYTSEDIVSYVDTINETLRTTAESKNFTALLSESPTADTLSAADQSFDKTINAIAAISVPQPFAPFHKKLLSFFLNQQRIFKAANDYGSDPLKAMIVLQNAQKMIVADADTLQAEIEKINSAKISFEPTVQENRAVLVLNDLFGIKKAHAFLFSIVFDPRAWGQMIIDHARHIWEWIYETVLRVLVNKLINQFQNQVVNWIAGKGKPMFITNWKGFLEKAGSDAAGLAIQGIAPGLCRSFGPLIAVQLQSRYAAETNVSCTLGQVEANLNAFYNNFSSGGFVTFTNLLLPQNNYWGSFIEASDRVAIAKAQAQDAAKNQAQASQGFHDDEVCVKEDTVYDASLDGGKGGLKKICAEYKAKTPGAAVGHALFTSQTWKGQQIISAKRLEELVAALVDAAINRVIQFGLSNLTEALNGRGADQAGNTGGTGTTADENKNITDLANNLKSQYQQIIDTDTKWLNLQPLVLNILSNVSISCATRNPSITAMAQNASLNLSNQLVAVQREMSDARNAIDRINSLLAQITGSTDPALRTQLLNQLTSEFSSDSVSTALSDAEGRYADLQSLQANAEANLPNSCSTPL